MPRGQIPQTKVLTATEGGTETFTDTGLISFSEVQTFWRTVQTTAQHDGDSVVHYSATVQPGGTFTATAVIRQGAGSTFNPNGTGNF